jgi:hypothetical protein
MTEMNKSYAGFIENLIGAADQAPNTPTTFRRGFEHIRPS